MQQQKLLLAGATGNLGRKIAEALHHTNYYTVAVVRSREKGESIKHLVNEYTVADVLQPEELTRICENSSVVVSALGKPVSPQSKDRPAFYEVDYKGNLNILNEAVRSGVQNLFMFRHWGRPKIST